MALDGRLEWSSQRVIRSQLTREGYHLKNLLRYDLQLPVKGWKMQESRQDDNYTLKETSHLCLVDTSVGLILIKITCIQVFPGRGFHPRQPLSANFGSMEDGGC